MPSLDPTFRKLDGSVTDHFDCGENDQNKFLRESAWPDQKQGWSVTYLAYVNGMLAGYVALSNDALELTKRERPTDAPSGRIGAVKIVQLGVDRRFQRQGLGEMLLDFAILYARQASEASGCRYVTLDSVPNRVAYYTKRGFRINEEAHAKKIKRSKDKDPSALTVSMRFDLTEPGQLGAELESKPTETLPERFSRAVGFAVEWAADFPRSLKRRSK